MLLRPLLSFLNLIGIPRLVMGLMLDRRVPLGLKMVWPAAVAYLIVPFDLLPDIITPFGRIDDLLVIVIALLVFLTLAPKEVVSEHLGRARHGSAQQPDDKPVVDGEYRFIDDPDEDRKEA